MVHKTWLSLWNVLGNNRTGDVGDNKTLQFPLFTVDR